MASLWSSRLAGFLHEQGQMSLRQPISRRLGQEIRLVRAIRPVLLSLGTPPFAYLLLPSYPLISPLAPGIVGQTAGVSSEETPAVCLSSDSAHQTRVTGSKPSPCPPGHALSSSANPYPGTPCQLSCFDSQAVLFGPTVFHGSGGKQRLLRPPSRQPPRL